MKRYFYVILFLVVTLTPAVSLSGQTPFNPLENVTETIGYYLNFNPTHPPRAPFADRAALMKQVGESLRLSRNYAVVYEDILGEGAGAWDSDRRYPEYEVNCIIWLQALLSDVYGQGLNDKTPVLDKIRYYGGHAGYGLRKHFIGRWLAMDPGPLKRLDFADYPGYVKPVKYSITLDLETFRNSMKYPGKLYREEVNTINLEYVKVTEFPKLAVRLEPGYYVMFGVPSDFYLRSWTKLSGPLGLVHAFLLHVGDRPGAEGNIRSYHASIISGTVGHLTLSALVKRIRKTTRGLVLYELVPGWDYSKTEPLDLEALAILVTETKLAPNTPMGTSFPQSGRNRIPKSVTDRIAKQRAERKKQ